MALMINCRMVAELAWPALQDRDPTCGAGMRPVCGGVAGCTWLARASQLPDLAVILHQGGACGDAGPQFARAQIEMAQTTPATRLARP